MSKVLKDDKENYEKRKALHVELQKTKKTHSRLDYRIFATQEHFQWVRLFAPDAKDDEHEFANKTQKDLLDTTYDELSERILQWSR